MEKKIAIDFMILALVLCAFLAGLLTGQKKEFDMISDFYEGYINNQCKCETYLIKEDGKISYSNKKFYNWSDSILWSNENK